MLNLPPSTPKMQVGDAPAGGRAPGGGCAPVAGGAGVAGRATPEAKGIVAVQELTGKALLSRSRPSLVGPSRQRPPVR